MSLADLINHCQEVPRSFSNAPESPHHRLLLCAAASTPTSLFEQTKISTTTSDFTNFPLPSLALLISLRPDTGFDKLLEVSQCSVNAEMILESNFGSLVLHGGEFCQLTRLGG